MLKLYSLQRRRDRYTIIYVWKILESIVPNLNIPVTCYSSIRRGRLCETSHVGIGHLGTLVYHSFRFRGIRLFNAMPKQIRDLSCSVSTGAPNSAKFRGGCRAPSKIRQRGGCNNFLPFTR